MKPLTLSPLLIGLASLPLDLMAQPVLNDIGDLLIGMEQKYILVQPASISAGPSGGNVTWDFSSLGTSMDTLHWSIMHRDSSQYGSLFPNATLVKISSDSSQLFVERGTPDRIWGYVSAEGLVIDYNDPYDQLTRPFTFGDSLTDFSQRTFFIQGSENSGSGSTLTHADAWGTLILPNGTYENVLRLQFEQNYSDTNEMTGIVIQAISRSYVWYNDEYRGELLRIDSTYLNSMFFNDTISSVGYLVHETPVAVQEWSRGKDLTMHFHGDRLHLAGDLGAGSQFHLQIFDSSGRSIQEQHGRISNSNGHTVVLSGLKANNIHLIRATVTGEGTFLQRTIKIIN